MGFALMVDSAGSSDDLWDDVVAGVGGPPAAWARYTHTGHAGATPLSQREASNLLARPCAIWLVYNGVTAASLSSGLPGGVADAQAATAAADALAAPDGTYVHADVEQEFVATAGETACREWARGWVETMSPSRLGGTGGIYGPLTGPLGAAIYAGGNPGNYDPGTRALFRRLVLWAAGWSVPPFKVTALPPWMPPVGYTELSPQVFGWQCTGPSFGGIVDLSAVRLPLPGPGGLWTPAGATPTAASIQQWSAAAAAARDQAVALGTNLEQLRRSIAG